MAAQKELAKSNLAVPGSRGRRETTDESNISAQGSRQETSVESNLDVPGSRGRCETTDE